MNHRIVILGFMACGKTTVAAEVARQLNCRFIDLDEYITRCHGRSPAEIIQQDGEAAFRDLETLTLRDVLQNSGARVIALGGGTWTNPANRTLIALHDCVSVWLDAPFELCWRRITASQIIRPLAPDRAAALERFEKRRADYALAKQILVSEASTPETLAEEILREF